MLKPLLVAAALTLSAFGSAHAGLIGTSLTATYQTPTLGAVYSQSSWTPSTFVVGAGQETDGLIEDVTHLLVDFTDNSLTITLRTVLSTPTWNAVPFNGPVFDSATPLDIASVTVDPATTMAGFDASRVTAGANEIAIDWNGLSYVDGTVVRIDFSFASVPEPVSISLFALSLASLAAARIGRQSRNAPAR
jgi:hypothetical protein